MLPEYQEALFTQKMTCSTPQGGRSRVGREGEKKDFSNPKPPGASVHCGLGKISPLVHSAGVLELLLLWCVRVRVFVSVYVHPLAMIKQGLWH